MPKARKARTEEMWMCMKKDRRIKFPTIPWVYAFTNEARDQKARSISKRFEMVRVRITEIIPKSAKKKGAKK